MRGFDTIGDALVKASDEVHVARISARSDLNTAEAKGYTSKIPYHQRRIDQHTEVLKLVQAALDLNAKQHAGYTG